ncbi:MAG: MFS transporter [Burkholderiales bacterium]|nr:MFS transporter [Burkholderiales bacterium]
MAIYPVLLIVLCNMTSLRGSKVLVSLFAIELGASQLFIGVIVALYSLFPLLLAIYAGKLADRLGVRTPILAGSIGMGVALLLPYAYPGMAALYASAALIGASHVFYNVSVQNLVGMLSGPDTRTRNFSNFGLVMAVGGITGPLLAGFSIDLVGHAAGYLCLAAIPFVSALMLSSMRKLGRPLPRKEEEKQAAGSRAGLLSNAPLRRTLITSGIILTGIDLFQFYLPIYGHSIGLSASSIGLILGAFAAASFVVRLAMPALVRKLGEEAVLTASLFCAAATYLMFPMVSDALLLAVIAFLLGLATGCGQPLTLMLIYSRAPEGRSGEAIGMRMTINNFTHIVVPLFFGTLGSAFGAAPIFLSTR